MNKTDVRLRFLDESQESISSTSQPHATRRIASLEKLQSISTQLEALSVRASSLGSNDTSQPDLPLRGHTSIG